MLKKTAVIIPSRLNSSRLPQKALADICGKSLIARVLDRANRSVLADEVIVATDHELIKEEVLKFGGSVVLTSPDHLSGTDRIAEAARMTDAEIIINLQGDEPLIDPRQIDQLITKMQEGGVTIGTLCRRIEKAEDLFNYNVVKVVRDIADKGLYFSRQALPAFRELPYRQWLEHSQYFRHVGMYGFRRDVLQNVSTLKPTLLESAESLEQLRWLENGFTVHCFETFFDSIGVDTPEDLERVRQIVLREKIR